MSAPVSERFIELPCDDCAGEGIVEMWTYRSHHEPTKAVACTACGGDGTLTRAAWAIVPERWWDLRSVLEADEWTAWMAEEGVIGWTTTAESTMPVTADDEDTEHTFAAAAE